VRHVFKILVQKVLGIPGYRWEDNIKMDLKDTVYEGVDWIIWPRIESSGELL
jgi:hypothetical protein